MFNFLFNVHCNRPDTTHSGSSSYFDRALQIVYFVTGREVPAGGELKPGADAQKQKGSTMQSEIEQLRLLMAFNGTQAERQALKSQLNEWVREINKCLAQLNA